jgi:hypothetical protein
MVSASDIAMISLLRTITDFGRDKILIEISEILLLLTFLSDNLSLGSCHIWKNKSDFLDHLSSSYLSETSPIYLTLLKNLSISSIDSLMDLMESAQDYLLPPSTNVDPNGVSCPYMFKRDSLVGVYLRTILVQWDLLQFGDLSQIFENYSSFISNSSSTSFSSSFENQQVSRKMKVLPVQVMKVKESPRAYLTNAELAINNFDLLPAVESIHSYFDSNGINPLRAKGDLISQTKTILENYSSAPPQQKTRFQQAMLSLANMWIRNGYYFYASTATEEGMKMAHQLGDHTSVTYALLLLHHIIHGQLHHEMPLPTDHEDAVDGDRSVLSQTKAEDQSTENILIRCIQKSSELNLKSLEIQAIQLLVRYRMNGPLKESVPVSLGYLLYSSSSSLPSSCEVTPYMLWALLQSTLTDRPSPLFAQATSQPKPKNPHLPPSHQPPSSSSSSPPPPPLSHQNKMEFFCQSLLLSSELWSRLSLPSMALLTCYRAFRHCGVTVSTNSFLQILLKYCSLLHEVNEDGSVCLLYSIELASFLNTVPTTTSTLDTPSPHLHSALQKLNLSLNILNNISRLLTSEQLDLSPDIKLKLQFSKYFTQMKQQLLLFLISLPSSTTSSSSSLSLSTLKSSLHYSHLLTEQLLNQPKFMNSNEYLLSCVYQCFLLSYFDSQMALDRIKELLALLERGEGMRKTCPGTAATRWKVEFLVMRIVILNKELSRTNSPSPYSLHREKLIELKIEMSECLERAAEEEYLPLVRGILSSIRSSLWRTEKQEGGEWEE